ncbi:MAG: hypothetical protein LBC55_01030 [Desulfovibrio sp.]|jgi:hypothetical protein|nr:hypothetical protein [Desulfovibrio sp.]
MRDDSAFVSSICGKRDSRLYIPGTALAALVGATEMLLICTTDRFLAAAPLALKGADIITQKTRLCALYGLDPETATLDTPTSEQFFPSSAWISKNLKAGKQDLYVLSKSSNPGEKSFCIDVVTPQEIVSDRVRQAFAAPRETQPAAKPRAEQAARADRQKEEYSKAP